MRTIILILVVLFAFSCKSETKVQKSEDKQTKVEEENNVELSLPKVHNDLEDAKLINLTYDRHVFEPQGIVFEEVNVLKTEEDVYSIILVLNKELTNFEELKKWKLGMYIYPVYPEEFEKEEDRKKGMRSLGILCDPVMMGDEIVIIHKGLRLKPKSFEHIRFYLYNNDGNTNMNYYKIRDVDFN